MKHWVRIFSSTLFSLSLLSNILLAQENNFNDLAYISPKPGSKYIMPENNIALRHGEKFDSNSIRSSIIEVNNERGEKVGGNIVLSDDSRTLIFLPEKSFELCSKVHVKLLSGLQTVTGKHIKTVEFDFTVTCARFEIDKSFMEEHFNLSESLPNIKSNKPINTSKDVVENNYPEGYAYATIPHNNSPHDGYYFYAPINEWGFFPETLPFINIIDKYGIPIYYRKFQDRVYDLKVQPAGYLSCYSFHPYWGHLVMDSAYNDMDIYKMGNGYTYTDFHEFQLLENGHHFVMTYDPHAIDMSLIVPGGDSEAIVSGLVFQELDINKNVVFQWRSWDHYEITETGPEIDLTSDKIDYVHGNTIEVESDTSLLISSRNFHEITKIDRNSGEMIWRLGGSQNQFEFINDTLGFKRQHDSRRNADGHVTLFDNGHYHPEPEFSSAVEYLVDPDAMTATLVNRYRHDPDNYGQAMGNAFWTQEESIVVGWGTSWKGVTEFDDDGNSIFEIRFDALSYRAYRFPWKTNRFYAEKDTLDIGYVWMEETKTKSITIFNNQDEALDLTSYHCHSDKFEVENEFPITIPANDSSSINITFIPNEAGTFEDLITLNSDINTEELVQRIAQQIHLIGHASENQSVGELAGNKFIAYPNPTADLLHISFDTFIEDVTISIYNMTGQKVKEVNQKHFLNCKIDLQNFDNGIYFMEVRSANHNNNGKIKIVKK